MFKKISSYLIVSLIVFFISALLIGLISNALNLSKSFETVINGLLGITKKPIYYIVGFLGFLGCLFVIKRLLLKINKVPLNKVHFYVVIGLMTILGLLNVYFSDVILESDPKRYYDIGLNISKDFKYFNFRDIFHQRALVYTAPIFAVFPISLLSIQLINLVLLLIAISLFTKVIKIQFGKQVAFYFLILSAFSFEFYSAITRPSHDIAFICSFAILSFILYRLYNSNSTSKILILSFLASLMILTSDLQRSVKIPIVISLLLVYLFQLKKYTALSLNLRIHKTLIVLIFSFVCFFGVEKYKERYGDKSKYFDIENMLYSYNDMYSKGDWHAGRENRYNYISEIENPYKRALTLEKCFSQIAHYPQGMLILFKNKVITFFSTTPWTFSNMDLRMHIFNEGSNWLIRTLLTLFFLVIKSIIFFFAVIGLLRLLNVFNASYNKIFIIFPLILLPLLLLSEVNPSYSLIIYPSLLFFAAIGCQNLKDRAIMIDRTLLRKKIVSSAIIIGSFFLIVFGVSHLYLATSIYHLVNFKFDKINYENKNYWINDVYPYSTSFTTSDLQQSMNLITNEPNYHISFFIKTKMIPELLNVNLNEKIIEPKFFHRDNSLEQTDDYYYYYDTSLKAVHKITISVAKLEEDVLIKDIILNQGLELNKN